MRTILALVSLLACLVSTTIATALTYRLEAHEKACYFAQVEHKGTKLAFYFAVCLGRRRTPVFVPGAYHVYAPASSRSCCGSRTRC
jgi:hypothetical protein